MRCGNQLLLRTARIATSSLACTTSSPHSPKCISAIEASKIAGHSDLEMTGEYTFVAPERQNELTRRIQQKLADAAKKSGEEKVVEPTPFGPASPDVQSNLRDTAPVTSIVQ